MTTPSKPGDNLFDGAEIIHTYSRAQALADGMLVDVSTTAREAGIVFPVALTQAAYAACVTWTRTTGLQDESGRLWDVVWMLSVAIRTAVADTDRLPFVVLVVPNIGKGRRPEKVKLTAVVGPGDTLEPVLTIMLRGED